VTFVRGFARATRAACGLPFLLVACAALAQLAPEPPSGSVAKRAAIGTRFMVTAAHPLAVDAGYEVLKRGGTAMDAAVAVQLVLGLVEPQSSGIGGGAFVVHYSADDRRVRTYDGREAAPATARPDRFTGLVGRPNGFIDAVLSGNSVGVPGTLAVLERAHRNHGRLEWAALAVPAIDLAENGFPVSPRLHALLEWDKWLARDPFAARHFYDASGRPQPVGAILRNPEYAAVLREVAAHGAGAFYRGTIARDVAAAVTAGGGDLTVEDLALYQSKERAPVCGAFRVYRVCGMGPPSSGGIAVLQILGIIERLPKTDFARAPVQAVHYFAEAARLAYADRDRYVADPDFVEVPMAGLLAPTYLADRARLVAAGRSLGRALPGHPAGAARAAFGDGVEADLPATTHFSIVDAEGNAVALTASIESAFGSHRFARGFLLNNELTDFSIVAEEGGRPVANRVEGRKRPRSSMSPTLVFDADGRLVLVVGSPGGHAIIHYVARVIVAVLDWGMPLQDALDAPHFGSRNGPTDLEAGTPVEGLRLQLEALGHPVRVVDLTSGVHAIHRVGDAWVGAADPRRDGVARGE
jgi:gamma-glutamyltranspeptidase/glutathione hydrolase